MNPLFLIARSFIFGLVKMYQWLISPILPCSCRYLPTCSEYALEAVRRYGVLGGTWIAIKRILKCHPWGGMGHDPVPSNQKNLKF